MTQRPEVKFIPTLLEEFLATLDNVLAQQQGQQQQQEEEEQQEEQPQQEEEDEEGAEPMEEGECPGSVLCAGHHPHWAAASCRHAWLLH